MSTAPSSTELPRSTVHSAWGRTSRTASDVVALVQFRGAALRGRSRNAAAYALLGIAVLTVLAAWLPGYLPGAAGSERSRYLLVLLPSAFLGVLVISAVSAVASGGGRELLTREQAVAFPVSTAADHLGALLMAPLNIAWLVQGWVVLGSTAYVVGSGWGLLAAQAPVLVWLFVATALAQLLAWAVEWLRRGPHGAWVTRTLAIVLIAAVGGFVATGRLVPLLDGTPTAWVAKGAMYGARGSWPGWLGVVGVLIVVGVLAVVAGMFAAQRVAGRPARDEVRAESSVRPPRGNPRSDLAALVRTDRVGVWRSVPLRRGLVVLAILPGLAALAGDMQWEMLSVLPGLAASGGALLFGVNAWCLDGRGALWRESLPVSPDVVFGARMVVLLEVLLLVTLTTVVLACLRAGPPTLSQLVGVTCATVVVCLQVVASSLRWSVRRPFSVDLRSARATPAPPLVMVGYSTRLALSTTLTGLVFAISSRAPGWRWPVLLALPFLLFSGYKLARTSKEWADAGTRSKVVSTVAS